MKMYYYVMPRDFGFAPNPYFGYCTLATGKPVIRKNAKVGDWIAAYGAASSKKMRGKLIYLMQVQETQTFDEYWNDERFKVKRPVFNKAVKHMYGDNIYHHENEEWKQEWSHHSLPDGTVNSVNLIKDTNADRVLIGTTMYYFGNNAVSVPTEFSSLIGKGRNHRVCKDERLINKFIAYIDKTYGEGIHGVPSSWGKKGFAHYKGDR